jgi:hypothetical protein
MALRVWRYRYCSPAMVDTQTWFSQFTTHNTTSCEYPSDTSMDDHRRFSHSFYVCLSRGPSCLHVKWSLLRYLSSFLQNKKCDVKTFRRCTSPTWYYPESSYRRFRREAFDSPVVLPAMGASILSSTDAATREQLAPTPFFLRGITLPSLPTERKRNTDDRP